MNYFSSCALASMLAMFHFTLWISYAIPFFWGALVVETFFLSIFWILEGNNTFNGFNSSFPDCAKSHCYKYIHVTMPPSNLLFKIRIEIFALVFDTPSACFLWSRSPTIRIKCHIWLWRLFLKQLSSTFLVVYLTVTGIFSAPLWLNSEF